MTIFWNFVDRDFRMLSPKFHDPYAILAVSKVGGNSRSVRMYRLALFEGDLSSVKMLTTGDIHSDSHA